MDEGEDEEEEGTGEVMGCIAKEMVQWVLKGPALAFLQVLCLSFTFLSHGQIDLLSSEALESVYSFFDGIL